MGNNFFLQNKIYKILISITGILLIYGIEGEGTRDSGQVTRRDHLDTR